MTTKKKKILLDKIDEEQIRRSKRIETIKKKLDKMPDKNFESYVKKICKGYKEFRYTPHPKEKYVEEMWEIVDVMVNYGQEIPLSEKERSRWATCIQTYRGFTVTRYDGQGSVFCIRQGKKVLGETA